MSNIKYPKWTVLYNIVSENSEWVGTGWEFFDTEQDALKCRDKRTADGCCVAVRPFYAKCDVPHLGAAHQFWM